MSVYDVILENSNRRKEAMRLNHRAGREVFSLPSQADLSTWIAERLGGVGRMADITNPEALLLPPLDQDLVLKVLADNPDKVTVASREVSVEYRGAGYNPVVRVNFQGENSGDWVQVPSQGILLPRGREVVLCSTIEIEGFGRIYVEVLSSHFVASVSGMINARQWEHFEVSTTKPAITTPNPSIHGEQFPLVRQYQYGTCVATGAPLCAYGTVVYIPSYYTPEKFEVRWFKDIAEAETERAKAVDVFTQKQALLREEALSQLGVMRQIRIDRRGQYAKPDLDGVRIDDKGEFDATPEFFWQDLLDLVEEFGRGVQAHAIYRGKCPILVFIDEAKAQLAFGQAQQLIEAYNSGELTRIEFWASLDPLRTKEIAEARARKTQKPTVGISPRRTTSRGGFNSIGDAFEGLNLDL